MKWAIPGIIDMSWLDLGMKYVFSWSLDREENMSAVDTAKIQIIYASVFAAILYLIYSLWFKWYKNCFFWISINSWIFSKLHSQWKRERLYIAENELLYTWVVTFVEGD